MRQALLLLYVLIYLVMDIVWITMIAGSFYRTEIESVQLGRGMEFKVVPAILAYITLLIIIFFICAPLSRYFAKKYAKWMVFGIVGFCVYGVYNFTNGAILIGYSSKLMFIDTLWGAMSFMFLGFLYERLLGE